LRSLTSYVRQRLDRLFGYDIFLSYSHADGADYAKALASRLRTGGKKFRVFLDRDDFPPGGVSLDAETERRVRMSTALLVVAGPHALRSRWVGLECALAVKLGKARIVIDRCENFDSEPEEPTRKHLKDVLRISEGPGEVAPSTGVLSEIGRWFKGPRRERIQLAGFACVTAVLLTLLVLAAVLFLAERRARLIATSRLEAADSHLLLDRRFDEAAATALRAIDTFDTVEARRSLLEILQYSPQLVFMLPKHQGLVYSLRFSPDGRLLLTGSGGGELSCWDVDKRELRWKLERLGSVDKIGIDASGTRAVVSLRDGPGVYDLSTGERVAGIARENANTVVVGTAASRGAKYVLEATDDGQVSAWVLRGGDYAPAWKLKTPVEDLCVDDAKNEVIVLGHERVTRFALDSGVKSSSSLLHADWRKIDLYLSSAKRGLTPANEPVFTKAMSVKENIAREHAALLTALTVSPDGSHAISFARDRRGRLWDLKAAAPVGSPLLGHSTRLIAAAFSPKGDRFATGTYDGEVFVWQTAARQLLGRELGVIAWHHAILDTTGTRLVFPGRDASVNVLSLNDAAANAYTLPGLSASIPDVAVRESDGCVVAVSAEGEMRVWDPRRRDSPKAFAKIAKHCNLASFGDDGRFVACFEQESKTIRVVDTLRPDRVGRELRIESDSVTALAISHDNKKVVYGGDESQIWGYDLDTGKPFTGPHVVESNSFIRSLAFLPGADGFIGGNEDGMFFMWHPTTGIEIKGRYVGYAGWIWDAATRPGEPGIATAEESGAVQLWGLDGVAFGLPLVGHKERVLSVRFRDDHLVSVDESGRTILWDLSLASWKRQIQDLLGRSITGGRP
jgi:WD40 repeat protein